MPGFAGHGAMPPDSAKHSDTFALGEPAVSERRNRADFKTALIEQERTRIAQDLHDETVGELTGVSLMADTLAELLQREGHAQTPLAHNIALRLKHALAELRSLVRDLTPSEISAGGLRQALHALALRIDNSDGPRCHFACRCTTNALDAHCATALYRIAQEAITNALKHAQARHIAILLDGDERLLRLEIRDDGRGLPQRNSAIEGMGLRNMESRIARIGGELRITSSGNGGTIVTCTLSTGQKS